MNNEERYPTYLEALDMIDDLKEQIKILKLSNDVLQEDNLDLSYNKTDLAYEYAKGMAADWEKGYQKEIAELKSLLTITKKALELACEKLPMKYEYCSSHPERYNLQDEYGSDEPYWVEEGGCEFDDPANCLECVMNYFKGKAEDFYK